MLSSGLPYRMKNFTEQKFTIVFSRPRFHDIKVLRNCSLAKFLGTTLRIYHLEGKKSRDKHITRRQLCEIANYLFSWNFSSCRVFILSSYNILCNYLILIHFSCCTSWSHGILMFGGTDSSSRFTKHWQTAGRKRT